MPGEEKSSHGGRKRLVVLVAAGLFVVVGAGFLLPRLTRHRESYGMPGRPWARVCAGTMHETAIAIARYRAETGAWPLSLDELRPEYLENTPRCPLDFVKNRASYLYRPPDGSLPVLSCERHWGYGYILYVRPWGDKSPELQLVRMRDGGAHGRKPSARQAREAFDTCKGVLISLAGALRAYKEAEGRLPGGLEELLPGYMSELPRCPRDTVEGRISYLYTPDGNEEVPLVTCERHGDHGYNLLIDRELHVRKVKKRLDWEVPPGDYDWREDSVLIE